MSKKNLRVSSLSILIVFAVSLALAGCGGGAPAKPEAKPEAKPAPVSRIDQIKKNGKLILATGN